MDQRFGQGHCHVGECFDRQHSINAESGSRRAGFRTAKVSDPSCRTERLERSEDLCSVLSIT